MQSYDNFRWGARTFFVLSDKLSESTRYFRKTFRLLLALDEKSQETLGHVDPAQALGGVAGLHQGLCPGVTILLDYFGMMRGWTMAR